MKRTTMISCVVFITAFCFVSMVTGQSVNNKAAEKYVKCLTNLQCRNDIIQRVVVDNTTYCCNQDQRLSIDSGLDSVLVRMSQKLSQMFYNTVMKGTFPGLKNINGVSKESNSDDKNGANVDSSASDSENSFSDSESLDIRSDSDSMETRKIRDFLDRFRSFVDSRSISEFLDGTDNNHNDGQNTRGLGVDDFQAIVSRFLNDGGRFIDKRAEMESKLDRDAISEDWNFSKSKTKRGINNQQKRRLALIKTTREDSSKDKLIKKRFRTELDGANNNQYRSGRDRWADEFYYFLKKRYLGQDEKSIRQDTDGGNRIERDEVQILNTIPADMLKRDTGFNSENAGNQRQNRDLDTPDSEFSETRLERQDEVNNAVAGVKRQQNTNPKPSVVNTPNEGPSNKGTGIKITQTASGGAQAGPLPAAEDKRKKYVQCRCLIGN